MSQQSDLNQDIFGGLKPPEQQAGQESKPPEGPSLISMQPVERVWGKGRDALAALVLSLICFLALFSTLEDYGITWDEAAPNFVAARMQAEWFGSLGALEGPFSKETIDRYWSSPSTHPSLTRSLMAISLLFFEQRLGEVRAMRLPSVLLASILVGVMYYWLSRRLNSVAALGAGTIWLTLPRVFGHLHIASLDVPMMVWWALTVMAFHEGSERALISRWHVLTGLLYGLALSTKLHSFFLPIPLVLWMVLQRRWLAWRNLVAMAVLGPAVYLLTQGYLWHDFWPRLLERYITYSSKDSIAR
jgi:4-amino-4-deoxy-L-arabinose transferase-like glycosyltransferase